MFPVLPRHIWELIAVHAGVRASSKLAHINRLWVAAVVIQGAWRAICPARLAPLQARDIVLLYTTAAFNLYSAKHRATVRIPIIRGRVLPFSFDSHYCPDKYCILFVFECKAYFAYVSKKTLRNSVLVAIRAEQTS